MKKFILAILVILPFSSKALSRISVQNGNWNNPSTWSPVGVPQLSDDTIIVATNVFLTGQHVTFGNSLLKIAVTGSMLGGPTDTLSFGGNVFEINNYLGFGVLIVGATDSVVNNSQVDVDELLQSGTMINHMWVCVATQLTTSDDFINNGSVTCGNWINSGVVTGNNGKFCIAQNFINSDQISGNIDICDASPGGLGDVNMGTISGSVTNCAAGPCVQCLLPGYNEYTVTAGFSIVPHPVQTVAVMRVESEMLHVNTFSQFIVTDVQGRVIRTVDVTGNQFSFDRTGMESGLYFYSFIHENELISTGKLLVN